MKIECILKRLGGSFVEVDGITYHFTPDAQGRHVADVKKKEHAKRFLAIAEGYEPVVDDEEDEPASDTQPVPTAARGAVENAPSYEGSPLTAARLTVQDSEGVRNDELARQEQAVAANETAQNAIEAVAVRQTVDETQDNLGTSGKIDAVAKGTEDMEGVGDSAAARNAIVDQPDSEAAAKQARSELAARYEERFGKKPHPRLSEEKLREALAAE